MIVVVIVFPRGIVDEILYKLERRAEKKSNSDNHEDALKNEQPSDESMR